MKKRNKKGTELVINTFVVIILAILVAVVLLVFWEIQTGKFSAFINNLFGKTNVDSLVTACNSLVSRNSVYEYCCVEKEVRYKKDKESSLEKTSEKGMVKEEITCKELADKEIAGGRIDKLNCQEAGC